MAKINTLWSTEYTNIVLIQYTGNNTAPSIHTTPSYDDNSHTLVECTALEFDPEIIEPNTG